MGALRKSNTRYFRNRSCGSRVFPLVAKQMSRKQVNRPSSMSHLMTYWLSTWLFLKVLDSGMHFVSDRQSVSSNPASDDTDLFGYLWSLDWFQHIHVTAFHEYSLRSWSTFYYSKGVTNNVSMERTQWTTWTRTVPKHSNRNMVP